MDPSNHVSLSKLYPLVDKKNAPLPSKWHYGSKDKNLTLSNKHLRVLYGNLKSKEAGTVRSDCNIPASCGVYYFEIRVLDKGREGFIGIGVNRGASFKSNRLPGWDKDSFGYHGDDGHAFLSNTSGVGFGPKFGSGDVVGCGVNFAEKCVFFTKNGSYLGAPFTDLQMTPSMYPVVGLQSPGEAVEANFGAEPFVFDFVSYQSEVMERCRSRVWQQKLPWRHGEWTRSLDSLVCSYLVHHGYSSTAESLAKSARLQLPEPSEATRQRQRLLQLVLDGEVQQAIDELQQLYPDLLINNPQLHFRLKCRQFIELISRADLQNAVLSAVDNIEDVASNGNAIVVDGEDNNNNSNSNNGNDNNDNKADNGNSDVDKVFQLGRELHNLRLHHNLDPTPLRAAISLIAYEDPQQSPMSQLLCSRQRQPLAQELNSAILQSRDQPPRPPLEVALSQTARCLSALAKHSAEGSVAFVADSMEWLQ